MDHFCRRVLRASSGLCLGALAACVFAGACTGSTEPSGGDSGGASGSAGNNANPNGAAPSECNAKLSLAPARIWRLTDDQVANAVRDLFGVTISREVSGARALGGSLNLAETGVITGTTASNYATAAQAAAKEIARVMPSSLGCGAKLDDACITGFLRNKVARAFRRPLQDTEVAELLAVYRLGAPDGAAAGLELMLEAVLQSGSFLWRTEIGADAAPAPGRKVTLTPFEVAAALGFFFLDSVPDDELWAAAQDGSLAKRQVLSAQVDRLLAVPRVRETLVKNAGQWVGLGRLARIEKDKQLFPKFTAEIRDALIQGEERFLSDVMWSGSLRDLFTSSRVYVNDQIASLYGLPSVGGQAGLTKVEPTSRERGAGILTHPAILAAHSSPSRGDVVHRGLFVYNKLFCGSTVPPPPASLAAVIAAQPKDASERELSGLRAANPSCKGCHAFFDPLGLAHDRYDAIGVYREKDSGGRTIDQSSVIVNLGEGIDGPIDGLGDVAQRLAGSRRAADCAVAELATMALGRQAKDDVTCALATVKNEFAKSGSFIDLYHALATSEGFTTRDVGEGK